MLLVVAVTALLPLLIGLASLNSNEVRHGDLSNGAAWTEPDGSLVQEAAGPLLSLLSAPAPISTPQVGTTLDTGDQEASPALLVATDVAELPLGLVLIQTVDHSGAGFLVDDEQILTAAHVVGESDIVTVHFFDGTRTLGTVGSVNLQLDLAVVRVERVPPGAVRIAWSPESTVRLAAPILSWGYPLEAQLVGSGFQMSASVSQGVISARRVRDSVHYLQTDAAMNPGSSGGPMTGPDGRLVGINLAMFETQGGNAEGIHFALDVGAHRAEIAALLDGSAP